MLDFTLNKMRFFIIYILSLYSFTCIVSQSNTQANVRVKTNDLRTVFEENGFLKTPDQLADLWLWLDGGDLATIHTTSACSNPIISNNDKVGCWQDKSGNGFDFIQTTNNRRPEVLLDTINGLVSAVNFSEPSKDILEHNLAGADELSDRDMTFFMVFRANVVLQKNNAALFSSADAGNINGSWEMDFKNTFNDFNHTARTGGGGNVVAPFDANVLDVKLYNYTYDFGGQEILTYVDGTQQGTSVLDVIQTEHMKLGVNRQGSTFCDAMISEVIIYDRKLSICEINEVILYLSIKYDQSSFQPIPVPGGVDCSKLFFWLRTDVGTSTITNGAPLALWEDKAFSNNQLGQTNGAQQPTYRDNVGDNINFHPVIDFDGVDDNLTEASVIGGTNEELTMYIVAKESVRKNNELLSLKSSTSILDRVLIQSPDVLGNLIWDAGQGLVPSRLSGPTPVPVNEPSIMRYVNDTINKLQEIYVNGDLIATDGTANYLTGLDITVLGGINNYYNGVIPELLVYETTFSSVQINNIDTYLAIKYGITLQHDYFDTDTTLIYDVSNGYSNGIFGVGLDLITALNQPKSKSQNIGESVTFELTNTISDKQFLISGHDGGPLTRVSLQGDPNVLTRKWFANMTGNVGTIDVMLDLANIGANINPLASDVRIVVADNPGFINSYFLEASSVIGGIAMFEGVALYDKYYTFSVAP